MNHAERRERLEREKERLFECMEEEESKNKEARSGESEQSERPAASSSGEVGAEVQRSRGGATMEQTTMTSSPGDRSTKKKAEEENKKQSEKKSNDEGEERGVKRSVEAWEALEKKIKTTVERKSEESANPGECMDLSHDHVAREI